MRGVESKTVTVVVQMERQQDAEEERRLAQAMALQAFRRIQAKRKNTVRSIFTSCFKPSVVDCDHDGPGRIVQTLPGGHVPTFVRSQTSPKRMSVARSPTAAARSQRAGSNTRVYRSPPRSTRRRSQQGSGAQPAPSPVKAKIVSKQIVIANIIHMTPCHMSTATAFTSASTSTMTRTWTSSSLASSEASAACSTANISNQAASPALTSSSSHRAATPAARQVSMRLQRQLSLQARSPVTTEEVAPVQASTGSESPIVPVHEPMPVAPLDQLCGVVPPATTAESSAVELEASTPAEPEAASRDTPTQDAQAKPEATDAEAAAEEAAAESAMRTEQTATESLPACDEAACDAHPTGNAANAAAAAAEPMAAVAEAVSVAAAPSIAERAVIAEPEARSEEVAKEATAPTPATATASTTGLSAAPITTLATTTAAITELEAADPRPAMPKEATASVAAIAPVTGLTAVSIPTSPTAAATSSIISELEAADLRPATLEATAAPVAIAATAAAGVVPAEPQPPGAAQDAHVVEAELREQVEVEGKQEGEEEGEDECRQEGEEESEELERFSSSSSERLSSGRESCQEQLDLMLSSAAEEQAALVIPKEQPARVATRAEMLEKALQLGASAVDAQQQLQAARSMPKAEMPDAPAELAGSAAAEGTTSPWFLDSKSHSFGHRAAAFAVAPVDASALSSKQHAMDALDVKERYSGPEHSAVSAAAAIVGHVACDLSARSMPLLSGKEAHAGSSAETSTDWKQAVGGSALERLAWRVEQLLSRSSKSTAPVSEPPTAHGMVSPFLRSSMQSEASHSDREVYSGTAAGTSVAWLAEAAATEPATPGVPASSRAAEMPTKAHDQEGLESPVEVQLLDFATMRSYSCASEASPRILTHASSAAVEYLPSDDDSLEEQPMQAVAAAASVGAVATSPHTARAAAAAEPMRQPQWGRAVSFALSIDSDDISALSDSTVTDLASEQQQLEEDADEQQRLGEAAAEEQAGEQVLAEVMAADQRAQVLPRAASFAISISSDSDAMSAVSESVVEAENAEQAAVQERAAAPQMPRVLPCATSFAISVSSDSDAASAVSGSLGEPENAGQEAALEEALSEAPAAQQVPQVLPRAVSFAVSVSSDSDAMSAVSQCLEEADDVEHMALQVAVCEAPAVQQQPQVLPRAVSFAVSASSDIDAMSAVSEAVVEEEVAQQAPAVDTVVDQQAAEETELLRRATSFAISVSSYEDAMSTASDSAALADVEEAGEAEAEAKARRLSRAVSFAVSVGSSVDSDSSFEVEVEPKAGLMDVADEAAGDVRPAGARQLGKLASFAVAVGSEVSSSESEPAHGGRRQLGKLASFAVPVGSEVSSAESERADVPRRQLGKLASFAVAVGSEVSSTESERADVPRRQLGKLASFAVPVGSEVSSTESERADVPRRQLGKLASFAVPVGSEVSSTESERADVPRRQLGKLASFALNVGSEASASDTASEAGNKARALGRAKSFALDVGSDCTSSDTDREVARV